MKLKVSFKKDMIESDMSLSVNTHHQKWLQVKDAAMREMEAREGVAERAP